MVGHPWLEAAEVEREALVRLLLDKAHILKW